VVAPPVKHYDGSTWTAQQSQAPAAVAPLGAVACLSANLCEAGGYSQNSSGFQYTFTESGRDGHWAAVPSETPTGAVVNLDALACTSPSSCVATGDYGVSISAPEFGFVESFDGTNWSVVSDSPAAGLNGLSCPTVNFCVAVGNNFAVNASPIEQYDGHTWSFVPSPVPGGYVYLNGVSCVSNRFCVAVGSYGLGNVGSFIEMYDGTQWVALGHPAPDSYLRAVSCTSPTFCVAVGNVGSAVDHSSPPVIETFDGRSWTVNPNPGPPTDATLGGVSCVSPQFCMAVGNRAPNLADGGASRGLIERYDGSRWRISQA
jgi:hypothetical protein